jgi:vacuolar-type H+-ATPase subunit H
MKQTAVEWLALYIKGITSLNCDEVIEQAKEMEKQQIIDAFTYKDNILWYKEFRAKTAEQYYNETFKK